MILLFANKTEQDIILKEQLEKFKPRVKVHYALDNPSKEWTGLKGYVNEEMLNSICRLDDPHTLYCHCGPGPMNTMIRSMFKEKYPNSTLFKY